MAEYYTLGASLPTLRLDDLKTIGFTSSEFVDELRSQAPSGDQKQLDLMLLPEDNRTLLALLQGNPIPESGHPYAIGPVKLKALVDLLRSREPDAVDPFEVQEEVNKRDYPTYIIDFAREYLTDEVSQRPPEYFYEDILANAYYDYVEREGNKFVRTWKALERNIILVLAAITVKRFDLDARKLIIGESELVRLLRSGNWSDVSFLEEGDVVTEITRISEEENLSTREHKIDDFKLRFLDNLTFADTFSINAMLAYLERLLILERWANLDKELGASRFKEIVGTLNSEAREGLDDFRRMNKKANSSFRK